MQKDKAKVSQQALNEFVATVDSKPDLTVSELKAKFPEFGDDDKLITAASDYYATVKSGKYKNTDEINAKFPEFFPQKKSSLASIPAGVVGSSDFPSLLSPDETLGLKSGDPILRRIKAKAQQALPPQPVGKDVLELRKKYNY